MKAILVIDMPDKCVKCPVYIHPQYCGADYYCHKEVSKYGIDKPNWCPLKPLPSRKDNDESVMVGDFQMDIGYILGWNECLEEIEK